MRKLLEIKAQPGYRLWVRYSDGVEGSVDLSRLVGRGVFANWTDPRAFEQVRLTDYGAPAWGDSVDLCPDALYLELTGQRPEDLFPSLRRVVPDA
jgi:hypothetical protein